MREPPVIPAASRHGVPPAQATRNPGNEPAADPAGDTAAAPAGTTNCLNGVCVTCSDEAVEVLVTKLVDNAFAMVDTGLTRELVSVALVDAEVGDTVLVHAKEAIGVVRRAGS